MSGARVMNIMSSLTWGTMFACLIKMHLDSMSLLSDLHCSKMETVLLLCSEHDADRATSSTTQSIPALPARKQHAVQPQICKLDFKMNKHLERTIKPVCTFKLSAHSAATVSAGQCTRVRNSKHNNICNFICAVANTVIYAIVSVVHRSRVWELWICPRHGWFWQPAEPVQSDSTVSVIW